LIGLVVFEQIVGVAPTGLSLLVQ